ncbi:MAG: hypothetical protein HKN16_08150 [Saprospiraceae bacterium]|nr:hypothetical protein [Saprospiraceae bacterium]
MNRASKSLEYFWVIGLLSILLVVWTLIHIYFFGTEEESIRILIRWTAKIAATLFAFAFAASSLHYFFPRTTTAKLLKFRPHLGLAFATFHTFHLFFLIWLQQEIHPVFSLAKTSSLLGGSLAYLLMYGMVLTTFPGIRKRLNPRSWKLLHVIGGYWIWFIFFRSYFRNVITKDQYYVLFTLFAAVLILRFLKILSQRRGLLPSNT